MSPPTTGYVSAKDFRWADHQVEFVPLGTGQVDPAIFRKIRATAVLRRDLETLRRLLAA